MATCLVAAGLEGCALMTVLTVRHDSLQTTVHMAVSDPAEHLIC